jgi:monofunctional biosynthetic peptidoglycan transglycosylase
LYGKKSIPMPKFKKPSPVRAPASGLRNRVRKTALRATAFILMVALSFVLFSAGVVLLLSVFNPPVSAFMMEKGLGAWMAGNMKYHSQHSWVSLTDISPYLCLAVVAAEDQRFPNHNGFDLRAIGDALKDKQKRRHPRGASTITQQTAKNLFLWPGRSLVRKGLEAYLTMLLELLWTKPRIMEVYLNTIELGEGIFGARAASQKYFHKPPSRLSMDEAALLAAVLPNPLTLRVDNPSEYVRERQNWIKEQMDMLGGTSYIREIMEVKKASLGKGTSCSLPGSRVDSISTPDSSSLPD